MKKQEIKSVGYLTAAMGTGLSHFNGQLMMEE